MFSILPNEVILDHSLTLIETRALIALYSYRDPKSTRPVWPGRAALSKRCGYHPDVISRTTTSLERKGWIRKIRRGKKRTNAYEIIARVTLPIRSDRRKVMQPNRSDPQEQIIEHTNQYLLLLLMGVIHRRNPMEENLVPSNKQKPQLQESKLVSMLKNAMSRLMPKWSGVGYDKTASNLG